MLFSQLFERQSQRYIIDAFNSKQAHHNHPATRKIRFSFLESANGKHPTIVFQERFCYLLDQVRAYSPGKDFHEIVRLIDSSTISLNLLASPQKTTDSLFLRVITAPLQRGSSILYHATQHEYVGLPVPKAKVQAHHPLPVWPWHS